MSRSPPDTTRATFFAKAEVTLDAPSELVWNAILDFPSYPTWNSVVRSMAVTNSIYKPLLAHPRPTKGAHVLIHVRIPPKGLDDNDKGLHSVKAVITYIDEARHIVVWEADGYPKWILRTERWQEVTEEQVDGKTVIKYMTVETFNGLAAPIIRFFIGKNLSISFKAMAEGLKRYAEDLAKRT